ncbi:MAG: ABC transporter permease [Clostridia bacterium]|nr:ABC transporter permease [Clostridia bacterium]
MNNLMSVKKLDIGKFIKSQGALIAFLLLFIAASIKYDQFLSFLNLSNVLRQVSMIGLVGIGMTFVILIGGIDLSVGAVVAVAGVLAANLSSTNSLILTIFVPILAATFLGFVNGFVVTKMKIVPFIATLAMMMGARGIAYITTGEVSVRVGQISPTFTALARGYILGLPVPAVIFVFTILAAAFISKYTTLGRHIYAVGGNEEAARMMGLKVDRIKMTAYTICSALAGFAGVILTARLGAGQPVAGEGWEMNAIAAVVLGGTQLTGGVGKFGGTFIGVLIIGIITNIFNMQGNINTWWQNVIMGALLLVVVVIQSQAAKSKKV